MSTLVNPNLITDLQKFGAADINACFSCGNCTAICPLADNDAMFPRKLIRLAQVGLTDDLVGSKELWTCYGCGLCTDRCPQEADPGEFMGTARRYAIAHYDKSGIARVLYTKPVLGGAIVIGAGAFFALFFAAIRGEQSHDSLALFDFIPYSVIHTTGIVLMVIVALFSLLGIGLLARDLARKDGVTRSDLFGSTAAWKRTGRALWYSLGIESLGQKRYRQDCEDDSPVEPLYRRRWLIHALTIWGFLGLLVATTLDSGMDLLGIKATGTPVPIWYPVRLIGTVAGLALMYGVTWFMIRRREQAQQGTDTSKPSDWLFLALLWITGLTGFLIEAALYAEPVQAWGYWVFLIHVAVAMELVLFLPFTKFAHAMYRPVSLFFYGLAKDRTSISA
ncbi:MAG TPA: 4Fe-4S dicluster domain-containing protein [Propionicimonas sp.]